MSLFDWIWRKFYGDTEEHGISKGRKYHFELPYTMSPSNVFYGVQLLQRNGMFNRLPEDMQEKMTRARNMWHPLRITERDLNRIDDETWKYIASQLHLKWSK
jgi:hypothetical protein